MSTGKFSKSMFAPFSDSFLQTEKLYCGFRNWLLCYFCQVMWYLLWVVCAIVTAESHTMVVVGVGWMMQALHFAVYWSMYSPGLSAFNVALGQFWLCETGQIRCFQESWKAWLQIWHARVSLLPSELMRFWAHSSFTDHWNIPWFSSWKLLHANVYNVKDIHQL